MNWKRIDLIGIVCSSPYHDSLVKDADDVGLEEGKQLDESLKNIMASKESLGGTAIPLASSKLSPGSESPQKSPQRVSFAKGPHPEA